MTKKTKSVGPNARSTKSNDTWTMQEYGDHLFSLGGTVYGTRSEMFNLSIASACLDVIQQDVSKTPLHLKRRIKNGSVTVTPNEHAVAKLIKSGPNEFMGMAEFLKITTMNLSIYSEYYIAARRNNNGEVIEFSGIPKNNISQAQINTTARKLYYDVSASTQFDQLLFGWASGRQDQRTVARINRRSLNGLDIISTSNISMKSLSLLSSMDRQQTGQYENGGIPNVAFAFPDGLSDEQFARLKEGLKEALSTAKKNGTPLVLEGSQGIIPKIERLSETANDADLIKSKMAAAMDVIRYFRVPPHKVFLMESVKYDNMEPAERIYVDDTLCSYFLDITQALGKILLTDEERGEYFFEFDVESAYAMSPKERQGIVQDQWTHGMISSDEMRRKIGQNSFGGDVGKNRIFSGNFVMINGDGEVIMRAGGNKPDDENGKPDNPDKKPKKGKLQ